MLRRGEEGVGVGDLDDLAGIHQRHALRHAGDDRQVVRDQHQAHAVLALQVAQQVEDLRLDRDVERGRRLVGDQVVGLGGQRHRDHHALLLAAAHAERVLVDAALGLGDADAPQPVDGLGARRVAAQLGVRLDRLDDLVADAHHRVQAGRRLLEDHADAPAAHGAHLRLGQAEHVGLIQMHAAAGDGAVLGQQAHQRQRRHALAAAGLADQREGLAALDRQAQAVDGAHDAGIGVELDLEMIDLDHGRLAFGLNARRGLKAARARVEGLPHAVGEQVGGQHQRDHEDEGRGEGPPDDGVAAHLVAREVDHAAEAVHRRVDTDADIAQHRLVQDQRRELEHGDDQHQVRDVGEDVADHDARRSDAEGIGGLHEFELAQLERLAAQQPAQPGPAGQAEHGAQQEELEVGALDAGLEQFGVLVEQDLHHQHAGSDQQDVRDRRQHRVEVLDDLVDPTLEVARHDAQHHGQRQRGHGRQRADHEGGADALERLVEHVVAGHVGAEHVVVAHQRDHRARQDRDHHQRHRRRPPGHGHRSLDHLRQRRRPGLPPPACDQRDGTGAQRGTEHAAKRGAGDGTPRHVTGPLRGRVLQVRAAMQQARRDALDGAVDLERLLGETDIGQRARVGCLARVDDMAHRRVEQRLHLGVEGRAAGRRACRRRQRGAEVHAVGQRHQQAGQQHDRRGQRRRVAKDLAPVVGQIGLPAHVDDIGGERGDEQPDGHVGPQHHELGHGRLRPQCSRTRGSAQV